MSAETRPEVQPPSHEDTLKQIKKIADEWRHEPTCSSREMRVSGCNCWKLRIWTVLKAAAQREASVAPPPKILRSQIIDDLWEMANRHFGDYTATEDGFVSEAAYYVADRIAKSETDNAALRVQISMFTPEPKFTPTVNQEASVAEQPTPQSALAQVQDLIGHHWDDDTYSAGWLARKIDAAINPLKSGAGR